MAPKKKQKHRRRDRAAIKEAVNTIPGLIVEEYREREHSGDDTDELAHYFAARRSKNRWLISGVVIFSAVIVLIWIVNTGQYFSAVRNERTNEERLFQETRQSFTETIALFDQARSGPNPFDETAATAEEKPAPLSERLKQNLAAIFSVITSTATSAASTSPKATTTTQ